MALEGFRERLAAERGQRQQSSAALSSAISEGLFNLSGGQLGQQSPATLDAIMKDKVKGLRGQLIEGLKTGGDEVSLLTNYSLGLHAIGQTDEAKQSLSMVQTLREQTDEAQGTSSMEDLRDIATNMLQCDITDPACYREANTVLIERKRQGAGESFNVAAAKEAGKGDSKSFQDEVNAIFDSSDSAREQLAVIAQSEALLDKGIFTGTAGEWMSSVNTLLVSLGIGEEDTAAGAEMFRVNAMHSIMAWVADTKGAISEKEMAAFEAASQGLSRTEAGNRLILKTARAKAEYLTKLENEYLNWRRDKEAEGASISQTAWRIHKREWVKDNMIVLPSAGEITTSVAGDTVVKRPEGAIEGTAPDGTRVWMYPDGSFHDQSGRLIDVSLYEEGN